VGVTRRLQTKVWWFPTIAACLALVAMLSTSVGLQNSLYVGVALLLVPITIASRRMKLIGTALCAVLSFVAVADATTVMIHATVANTASWRVFVDVLALISAILVAASIAIVARNRRGRDFWGVLADAGIVALGSWLLCWITLVRPAIDKFDRNPWIAIVHNGYEPLGSIVLFLLIMVLFSDTVRSQAVWLVSASITMALGSDLLVALSDAGHAHGVTNTARAMNMIAYGFAFATLLHPSMRTLSERQPVGPHRPMVGRIIVTATSLVVPIMVASATVPRGRIDLVVRTVSVGALALLVTVRVMHAVRENRAAQEELLQSAQTDSLTGLPNRARLLEHVHATLRDSWKGEAHPTLFFIDIDRFKNINDSLGHAAGDQVLCTIADRLRRAVPARAVVARISGDEYVVLDPASPSLIEAMSLADLLLSEFHEPLPLTAGDVFVTASIGVARSDPQSHRSADLLLRHADTAMYQAKDAGRNCVALFDESMHERVAHRLAVETALFRALDRHELRMFHQPILEMSTGDVIGFEALMRWRQGDGTIVSPAEFIPIAEETGTIIAIGSWALLEALNQLRDWIDEGVCSPTASMSVNVSPRQLADPNFPSIVNEALQRSKVSPHLLWLEVTEGIMISEPELALATLRRLRSLGVRVALDDFGTGYSSLSLLQKFPLQRIKIDRAFVQGVADNANDRSLVRTIIAMGSSLGLDMVAEGVETVQQLQVLSELGCTKAQGYLISHPIPADAMRSTVTALERMGAWPGVRPARVEQVLVAEEQPIA
jgi:diguanylate cyclase (GGDEF)-like protein